MTRDEARRALLAIDFVNEIVDPKGKLAGRGYSDFLARHGTLARLPRLLKAARQARIPVFHVRVGFSADYLEQPEHSPLFGPARKNQVFRMGTWNTEFHEAASPEKGETIIQKHRVSAFYGTPLDLTLRNLGIGEVIIVGVATDLAVQTAARDAHDRGYRVRIVADCCAAASDRDHEDTLRLLEKVAAVDTLEKMIEALA
jgi:nicotinamidase-related amidase